MQHHQQTARENAGGLRSAEIYENQPSSATILPNLHPMSRPQVAARATMDLPMADPPNRTPSPRRYSASSLTEAELETVAQLVRYLASNPFAYESHVQLVKLLHQGLVSHMNASSSPTSQGDPRTYDLLQDLQSAREAMNATFALGEDLWMDWIEDQKLLATTLDDKITVIESFQKAVEEESGSTRLWLLYAEWMLSLYKTANPQDQRIPGVMESTNTQGWSEEDKMVAREVCSWQQMLEVWRQGVDATKWRINDSHLLWDQYTELLIADLANIPIGEGIRSIKGHYLDRLQTPHATWDQTFQSFSTFVSRFYNASYEDTMVAANKQGAVAKCQYSLREDWELKLQQAKENKDHGAEWRVFGDYIDWEGAQSRKKTAFSFELIDALYQRATLRFPTDTNFWECYVMFLNNEFATHERHDRKVLPVLERATRHCPWSGTLWSQQLLTAERNNRPFPEIQHIKHKATSTGLLDAGDMTEVLKVHTAWCGYLRRWAFYSDSTDDEMDVAEVGIRSAIEDMDTIGRSKYGEEYKGDTEYRLERIYIKYLSQCRNWQGARDAWKGLVAKHGDSYEFWLRYYMWEMSICDKTAYRDDDLNGSQSTKPMESTKILRQALKRPKMDWPEKILEVYENHCEDHEDVEELQSAVLQIWKTRRTVKKRREKEALEAYEAAQAQALQHQETQQDTLMTGGAPNAVKRKREDEDERPEGDNKKVRANEDAEPVTVASLPKRDRENATVIVKNLPVDTSETRVRQYFRDCGTINSLKLVPDGDQECTTATIEFDSKEDVLTAQTKDMKSFDGNPIEIQVGTGLTLFVTNFPPTADEDFIRQKFEKFGQVVDIRFPSLKGNTHRRFCYVQFKNSSQAKAATELDGEVLGEDLKMLVKMSDPGKKQERVGPLYEGRELHLRNIDWSATEDDIQQVFSKYGKVERVRLPKNTGGKSIGFGFVVFSSKEEAIAALELNLTKLKSRLLNVSLSTSDPAKRQASTITTTNSRSSASPSPALHTNGNVDNPASPASSTSERRPSYHEIQSRTVALLNVPDTVNDARIRALAEQYGPLVKVVLRPDHQGATIEYKDVASAGKAALGIDGHEISPGRKLGVGSVKEMLQQREEIKHDRIRANGTKKQNEGAMPFQVQAPIRRPNQPGTRRGGKGGLGVKRGGVGWSGPRATTDRTGKESEVNGSAHDGKAKSNDDFKHIFLKESSGDP